MYTLILWDTHDNRKRKRRGYCNCSSNIPAVNERDEYGYLDVVLNAPRCSKCGSLITIRSVRNNFNNGYRFRFIRAIFKPVFYKAETRQHELCISVKYNRISFFSFIKNIIKMFHVKH